MLSNNSVNLIHGDSLTELKKFASNRFDSLVTDPPCGINFLDQPWDSDRGGKKEWSHWFESIMKEVYRVMKPGSFGLVWSLPRKMHWTASSLEESGFLIKDVVTHLFATGFPKSLDIAKAIKKTKVIDSSKIFEVSAWIRKTRDELGLTNQKLDIIAGVTGGAAHWTGCPTHSQTAIPPKKRWDKLRAFLGDPPEEIKKIIQSAHEIDPHCPEREDLSKKWYGYGTSLRPSCEYWILVQKPISSPNVISNLTKHGVGALNINGSRVKMSEPIPPTTNTRFKKGFIFRGVDSKDPSLIYEQHPLGRYPTHFLMSEGKKEEGEVCPVSSLNQQAAKEIDPFFKVFYAKKPSRKERGKENTHPTVKSLSLLSYLCQLITPPGGTILDPFMGSGSTGVAAIKLKRSFLGIEKYEEYFEIASKRINKEKSKELEVTIEREAC